MKAFHLVAVSRKLNDEPIFYYQPQNETSRMHFVIDLTSENAFDIESDTYSSTKIMTASRPGLSFTGV